MCNFFAPKPQVASKTSLKKKKPENVIIETSPKTLLLIPADLTAFFSDEKVYKADNEEEEDNGYTDSVLYAAVSNTTSLLQSLPSAVSALKCCRLKVPIQFWHEKKHDKKLRKL